MNRHLSALALTSILYAAGAASLYLLGNSGRVTIAPRTDIVAINLIAQPTMKAPLSTTEMPEEISVATEPKPQEKSPDRPKEPETKPKRIETPPEQSETPQKVPPAIAKNPQPIQHNPAKQTQKKRHSLSKKSARKIIKTPHQATRMQQFLGEVKSTIARNKTYPKAAIRRRLQGRVTLSFTLLQDGSISQLQVTGGAMLLRKAARDALWRSAPFRVPAALRSKLPLRNLSVSLEYTLK
jgi:protein TonB